MSETELRRARRRQKILAASEDRLRKVTGQQEFRASDQHSAGQLHSPEAEEEHDEVSVSPYPDPRPSAGYPRPSAGYPRPSAGYPRPSAGYPRPSPGDPCSSSANSQVLTETLGPLAEVLGEEVAPGSNDVIASDSQNAGKNTWTETGLQWLLLGMLARLAVASTAVSNQSLVLAFAVIKSISLAFASGRQARQEQKNFARLVEVALVMCGVRDTLVRRSFRVGSVVADIWSTFLIFVFGVVVTHVCMVLAFYH